MEKKGITIEIGANTSKFDKAIKNLNKETRKIDSELKKVNNALKFNPKNVELWRQKQDLLKKKITETEQVLDQLKQKQAVMDAKGVDKNSEEYRKLQREIIETESKLKHFNSELIKVGNVKLRALSEQFKEVGSKLESAGHAMQGLSTVAAVVATSIGALAVKSGKWADDLVTMSKIYSIGTDDLQKYAAAAELVDVDVETIAKSHIKLEKQMNSASKGTGASAEAFEKLGVSVTDSNGELRDSDEVWQEVIQALGKVENETERDALAMQLMGKSASELNPLIEDGGEAYEKFAETLEKYDLELIDEETLKNANKFNDELDTIKALGLVAFQNIGTQLAGYLAPALEKVVDLVGRIAQWLTSLSPRTQTIIAAIAGVIAVTAPLLIGLGKLSFAISSILSLGATLIPLITGVAGTLLPIVAIIAGVVAAGVLLYKNWDTIKAKAIAFKNTVITNFNDFKNKVTTTFNNIKTAIVTPIQTAIDKVKSLIDKIKGWFPIKLGKIFSGLKLPHFSLNWASKDFGKLGSIKYPTGFNVDWYAKGGIFDSPTVIGVGEAGSEAVVPLDKFWDKLDKMQGGETNIVININGANKDPREIAEEVKRILIKETNNRRLAWQ